MVGWLACLAPGPNLTIIVPQWTRVQIMTFFSTGTLPGGGTVPILSRPSGFSETRMPWSTVHAATTEEERKAMYAYLHNLPLVEGPAQGTDSDEKTINTFNGNGLVGNRLWQHAGSNTHLSSS